MATYDFKANNKMPSARDFFVNRSLYNGFAFSDGEEPIINPESTKNFWFTDNLFYGRIRQKNDQIFVIEPKLDMMVPIRKSSQATPVAALDFIVDAYKDFRREYKKSSNTEMNFDTESKYLKQVDPVRGFTRVDGKYDNYQANFYSSFVSFVSSNDSIKNKISSFETFVEVYASYIYRSMKNLPFTRCAFILNKFGTPTSSGLCIEIADLGHGSDAEKAEFFLDDCNFEFYKILAASSGFAVDKNAPWRLVADLSSTKMLEFATARNSSVTSAEDILDLYFENTYEKEMIDIQKNMIFAYNSFCSSFPRSFIQTTKDGKKTSSKVERTAESSENIISRVSGEVWLRTLVKIKNIENNLNLSDSEISKIVNNAHSLENSFDTSRALGYINKRMPSLLALEGSLNFEANRISADGKERSGAETKERVQRGVVSFFKNIY